jgi:hypothetical protein
MTMRSLISGALLAMALCATAFTDLEAQSFCRSPDQDSEILIEMMRRYATAPPGNTAIARDSLKLVPASASQVTLVSNSNTCKKANDAYKLAVPAAASGFSNRVHVVAVGSRYAVLDPQYDYDAAGVPTIVIFDNKWKKLSVTQ